MICSGFLKKNIRTSFAMNGLEQRFPTILVPGTGFVEDSFPTWHREGGGG